MKAGYETPQMEIFEISLVSSILEGSNDPIGGGDLTIGLPIDLIQPFGGIEPNGFDEIVPGI